MIRAFFLSLIFASLSLAQSVTLPAKVQVEPGRLASVVVEWEGDDINWLASPELDVFREYDANPKVVRLRVFSTREGTHKIVAVTCKDKKLSPWATCDVVVGKPEPGPGPGPGPTPVPDALVADLQKAFDSEKEPAELKVQYKAALAGVYKAAAKLDLKQVTTASQLFSVLKASSSAVLSEDNISQTRTRISLLLKEVLPKAPDAALTDEHRTKAKALFERLVAALEKVK